MSLEDNENLIKVALDLPTWQRYIMNWAESKGWNQNLEERSFGDWITLMHTELSEAYEDYRKHYKITELYFEVDNEIYSEENAAEMLTKDQQNRAKPCGIPIEIADLAIRMLHFCEYFGINLNEMIALKMRYNETRPHRHGGKKV